MLLITCLDPYGNPAPALKPETNAFGFDMVTHTGNICPIGTVPRVHIMTRPFVPGPPQVGEYEEPPLVRK